MISIDEVQHIAKLARLELGKEEVEKMQKDMSAILDYFNLLKKAPKPKALLEKKGNTSSLREDETKQRSASTAEKIIASFPDKKDGYIKVKNIF